MENILDVTSIYDRDKKGKKSWAKGWIVKNQLKKNRPKP